MMVPSGTREQARQRAGCACEYCGVTETDAGGPLTLDHFQPRAKGGTDDLENLIHCCVHCNQYKHDYWPHTPNEPRLWNPRHEPVTRHFVELDNGHLHALTGSGTFTLGRLRLNRPALVAWRQRRRLRAEELRLLERYREVVELLSQLHREKSSLLEEQQALLIEQQALLRLLLGDR